MKAAFLTAPEKMEICEAPAPQPASGEVLIRPTLMGVCGSDVSFFTGHRSLPYPFLIGHEVLGQVVFSGEGVTKLAPGQRVIVEPNYSCGKCKFCLSGRASICPNKKSFGVNIPGCFSELAVAPAEFVWPIPDDISDQDAAVIEPLAVSLSAFRRSGVKSGETIAVLGCGATGLLLIQAAVEQGVRVLAHDKFEEKMEMARSLGAEAYPAENPESLWLAQDVTTVFECAGAKSTVETALSCTPRGGQVVLVGLSSSPVSFVPLRFVREGISLHGSIIYDHPTDFQHTLDLVKAGRLSPSKIVTQTFPFSEIQQALQLASTGQAGKVLVRM